MARFTRLEVYNTILDIGAVPLFYNGELSAAIEVAAAAARGGARVIEFTNRGEMAYSVFTELVRHFAKANPSIILGVGSVIDAPTAALYLASGANFIVGPSFNPEISRLCNRRKIAYLPGCATENEITQAEEAGAEICKIFPGESAGGPAFVSAVLAPCPWHRLLPTGGVDATESSISEWIKAGASAVGMGSKLISAAAVKDRNYDLIASKTAQTIAWIRKARGVPLFLGFEHSGLYPLKTSAEAIAAWYEKNFGFAKTDGNSSCFLSGAGAGRLEVMKKVSGDDHMHVAIQVSNFEEAMAALQAKGVALKEPNIKPDLKAVYLQEPDPEGNPVHLWWGKK
jgi:2-dehydro-3-deoxyphosphogluconate aldolase / (4S)-4-hydroxy-2-oxoglutarate aldolase